MREWRWKCGSRDRGGGGFSSCFNNETLSWKLKSSGVFMWTALVFVYVSVRCATSVSARPLKCVYVCVYICISVCVRERTRVCLRVRGQEERHTESMRESENEWEEKKVNAYVYILYLYVNYFTGEYVCVCVSVF